MNSRHPFPIWLLCGLLAVSGASGLAQVTPANADFTKFSLDELLQTKIVSVSKKPETVFDSAAAVFVITGSDVERSGSTSLASALRLSPGVQVARLSASNTAVTARGFNDISANKLLVLMDGRSIYSPLFSGVVWEDHEYVLEDLERIEVVRGPGATLWGANAVNGVINIKSKSAADTEGTLLSVTAGDWYDHSVAVRHGWRVAESASARIYAKTAKTDAAYDSLGNRAGGSRENDLVGFRFDKTLRRGGEFTFQTDWRRQEGHAVTAVESLMPPYVSYMPETSRRTNFYALSRLSVPMADDGEFSVQMYYDYTDTDRIMLGEKRHLGDLDLQLRRHLGERHDVVLGAEARVDRDKLRSSSFYAFTPEEKTSSLVSCFVQDEVTIIRDRAWLTLGTKLEDGETFDLEVQPNVRVLFHPHPNHTIWASVARAARTPSRAETTTRLFPRIIPPNPYPPLPTQVIVDGSPDYDSERLTAWEIGYRWSAGPRLSLDATAFYNNYTGIRSIEPVGTNVVFTPVPHIDYVSRSANGIDGNTYGGEIVTNWQPYAIWRLQATATFLRYDLRLASGSQDMQSLMSIEGSSPRAQYSLRSQLDVAQNVVFDALLQHTGKLAAVDVPSYTGLDVRLGWSPRVGWKISLVGQDLLEKRHAEFPPTFLGGETLEIPRSWYARVEYRF